jgi:hypothetical protein
MRFEWYSKAVYEQAPRPIRMRRPSGSGCARRVGRRWIKEQRQQWRDAIILYQKLADLCPDMKTSRRSVRKLRVEHLILF